MDWFHCQNSEDLKSIKVGILRVFIEEQENYLGQLILSRKESKDRFLLGKDIEVHLSWQRDASLVKAG